MLNLSEKIQHLENCLSNSNGSYTDSFKFDILLLIKESNLKFIDNLNTKEDIESWIKKLTSRIVLKFDEENEQLSDFISDYIEFG